MDISCHSFIRMVKSALPLLSPGGSIMTISYHGAEEVVDRYNIMGRVKAALQSTVRYLASDRAKSVTGGVHYIDGGVNIMA
ncbi:MAG: SDR family oxidoreductase [Alphaproteobacteria bacterium]|nr:SDR family oxidoreductase [Alphaproteobacteria bacterium]